MQPKMKKTKRLSGSEVLEISKIDSIITRITNFINSEDAKKMSIDAIKAIILAIVIAGFSYGGFKVVEELQSHLKNDAEHEILERAQPFVDNIFNMLKEHRRQTDPKITDNTIKNEIINEIYKTIGIFVREHYKA